MMDVYCPHCSINLLENHFWNEGNWSSKYIGVVPKDPEVTEVCLRQGGLDGIHADL